MTKCAYKEYKCFMLRSMTAYGRSNISCEGGSLTFEIHAVNRKNLDINSFMPKDLLYLDMQIRKWIEKRVKRGQLLVRLSREHKGYVPNIQILKKMKGEWEAISQELDLKEGLTLPFLVSQMGKEVSSTVEEAVLEAGVFEALDHFMAMREKEGEAIRKDLTERLGTISRLSEEIGGSAAKAPEELRRRLKARLTEFELEDADRVAKEVVIFAEKADVTEEIVRLKSHIAQFQGYLDGDQGHVGRTLDFLCQEMLREMNTIASKTGQDVVMIKSELERIREQVQNIE